MRKDGLPSRGHEFFRFGILQAQKLRRLDGTALQARRNVRVERRRVRLHEEREKGLAPGMR